MISIQFELSSRGEKRDTGKRLNVLARNASWPNNPRSAARRAAQDLVIINKQIATLYSFTSIMEHQVLQSQMICIVIVELNLIIKDKHSLNIRVSQQHIFFRK